MTTTITSTRRAARSTADGVRASVIVGGDDVYEDLFGVSDALAQLLAELGIAAGIRVGTAAFADGAPDLFVLETAVAESSTTRVDALREAIRAGSGLLVVHASAVLFDSAPERELAGLVGARFASHGPRPRESRFTVELDPRHPITAGLDGFEIDHEHYLLELAEDAAPIAWRVGGGRREPIVTVRSDGAGRICYFQLGHDTRPLGEPAVRELLARCVGWLLNPMED